MSIIELLVTLPSLSHSFIVQVPRTATIADVKLEIKRTCPGSPHEDGQKLIWRGRFLKNEESVADIWQDTNEPKAVHLAVHPSAWTSHPPDAPQPQAAAPREKQDFYPDYEYKASGSTSFKFNPSHPLAFVLYRHTQALSALSPQGLGVVPPPLNLAELRTKAVQVIEGNQYAWPEVLDKEFPSPTVGGAVYNIVTKDGQPYLHLQDSSVAPTPSQQHALEVLSYTFTLMTLPISTTTTTSYTFTDQEIPHGDVNLLLQQLGLPQLRVPQDRRPSLRLQDFRPLIITAMGLALRTSLLMYFIAPARSPIFMTLIFIWMAYEIWVPIHALIRREAEAANGVAAAGVAGGAPANAGGAGAVADAPAAAARRGVPAPRGAAGRANNANEHWLLDLVAKMNVEEEDRMISEPAGQPEPSLRHKAFTFVVLFVATMLPEAWNRRRVALRRRETQILIDHNVRETVVEDAPLQGEGPPTEQEIAIEERRQKRIQAREEMAARYALTPIWIRRYFARTRLENWVDDD